MPTTQHNFQNNTTYLRIVVVVRNISERWVFRQMAHHDIHQDVLEHLNCGFLKKLENYNVIATKDSKTTFFKFPTNENIMIFEGRRIFYGPENFFGDSSWVYRYLKKISPIICCLCCPCCPCGPANPDPPYFEFPQPPSYLLVSTVRYYQLSRIHPY